MSKGLEKLKTIRHIHDMECGKDQAIDNDFDIIEKELKEHEKDKKMLEIFKNALTIEHHEIPLELINSRDIHEFISGITKQIPTIKENELDTASDYNAEVFDQLYQLYIQNLRK